jgi:hypothetical protein
MVFNTTFNNISVISWSVLLVEETGVPAENHWQTSSHNIEYNESTPCLSKVRTHNVSSDSHSSIWSSIYSAIHFEDKYTIHFLQLGLLM